MGHKGSNLALPRIDISLEKDLEQLSKELSQELCEKVEVVDTLKRPIKSFITKSANRRNNDFDNRCEIEKEFNEKYDASEYGLSFILSDNYTIGLVYKIFETYKNVTDLIKKRFSKTTFFKPNKSIKRKVKTFSGIYDEPYDKGGSLYADAQIYKIPLETVKIQFARYELNLVAVIGNNKKIKLFQVPEEYNASVRIKENRHQKDYYRQVAIITEDGRVFYNTAHKELNDLEKILTVLENEHSFQDLFNTFHT